MPVSINRIDLRWTDHSAEETVFNLERSTNGTSFTRLAALGPNSTNFANTGLLTGMNYYYRVNAANSIGKPTLSSLELDADWANVPTAGSIGENPYLVDNGRHD